MKTSQMPNPNRRLTDNETIEQLQPLLDKDVQLIAINQNENLALIKHPTGNLETYSYFTSAIGQLTEAGWKPVLEHFLLGSTHHCLRDFQLLFSGTPVGMLKLFQSDSEKLYVNVHRVGRRRKFMDEIGNIFVKVSGQLRKFLEQKIEKVNSTQLFHQFRYRLIDIFAR